MKVQTVVGDRERPLHGKGGTARRDVLPDVLAHPVVAFALSVMPGTRYRAPTRLLAVLTLFVAGWASAQPAPDESRQRNIARAQGILDLGGIPVAGLLVEADLEPVVGAPAGTGRAPGRLSARITVPRHLNHGGPWAVTLVATAVDEPPLVHHDVVEGDTGEGSRGFTYRAEVMLPADFQEAVLVVEETSSGAWGGTLAELVEIAESELVMAPSETVPAGGDTERASAESTPGPRAGPEAEYPVLADRRLEPVPTAPRAQEPPEAEYGEQVIRLVPPAGQTLTGRTRFRTVVTTPAVARAVFTLDGRVAAEDGRVPFAAVLDLGSEVRPRRVGVTAYDSAGRELGTDLVEINLDSRPFRVAITRLETLADGRVRIVATVSVPPWEKLARVEAYRNEELIESSDAAEAAATGSLDFVLAAGGPSDFVRVVATLANGETREDARLISDIGTGERVEVNLVEVYAVVTDRSGDPVRDLQRERFSLRRGRREVEIERFALADEVPLVLGLIIDSSESMMVQMVETRKAAARFVSTTIQPADRAFLVDFDTQPRLAQALTADVRRLLASLGTLRAGGATAIFDAAIFSLAQFEREPGRRALVLLTDGVDYGSRFGAKRGVEEARRLGVPLYVIAMSPEQGVLGLEPGRVQRLPPVDLGLEAFTQETGGRLFKIQGMNELDRAYQQINAELRSQYLLTFSSEEPLSDAELRSIKVRVDGRGLSVRTVVLNR